MTASFNSIDNIVNLSIKYQIGYLERILTDSISKFSDKTIIPFTVEFCETGAENHPVIRRTAEFLFSEFNWQGCRVYGSSDLVSELPARVFTRYSITFFFDTPNIMSIKKIITILTDSRLRRLLPKLTRDNELRSAVSQRVLKDETNPATVVEVLN